MPAHVLVTTVPRTAIGGDPGALSNVAHKWQLQAEVLDVKRTALAQAADIPGSQWFGGGRVGLASANTKSIGLLAIIASHLRTGAGALSEVASALSSVQQELASTQARHDQLLEHSQRWAATAHPADQDPTVSQRRHLVEQAHAQTDQAEQLYRRAAATIAGLGHPAAPGSRSILQLSAKNRARILAQNDEITRVMSHAGAGILAVLLATDSTGTLQSLYNNAVRSGDVSPAKAEQVAQSRKLMATIDAQGTRVTQPGNITVLIPSSEYASLIAPSDAQILAEARSPMARKALAFALAQRGDIYHADISMNDATGDQVRFGMDEFDCSGLAWRSYQQAGLDPGFGGTQRVTTTIINDSHVERVPLSHALPGDLVFMTPPGDPLEHGHMGVVVGNGFMIEASSKAAQVRISNYLARTDTEPFAYIVHP